MREYIFRGKCVDTGEWVEGSLWNVLGNDYGIISNGAAYTILPETVGQYTGLRDKNGKRIFEDDIVLDEESGYKYQIKWDKTCYVIANLRGTTEFDDFEFFINDITVVGNVYDNPELMRGGTQ